MLSKVDKEAYILEKEKNMAKFIKAMDDLPLILKIILALPMLDIVWSVYRIVRSVNNNSIFGIVLGVIILIIGIPFLWLIDIITLIFLNKVLWVD